MKSERIETIHLPDPPGAASLGSLGDGVRAHWHMPPADVTAAGPGLVVLPIQGGDYEISTLFARHFAAHGHHCLRFERRAEWLDATRPPAALGTLLRTFRDDVRRGIDWWLESAPVGLDLGLFGVSMGAMSGILVAANEPRIGSAMLVMGGGPLSEVLGTARDREINLFRAELAARLGVTEPDLVPLFREALKGLDPLEHAHGLDASTTLMVSSRFDRVVRYQYQTRLWEALGKPRRSVLPCGHYSATLFVPWIKRLALRWFSSNDR